MTFEDLQLLYENMINAQLNNSKSSDFGCEENGYYCGEEIQDFLKVGRTYYQNENLDIQQIYDLFKKDLRLYFERETIQKIQNGEGYTLPSGIHVEPQFMTSEELVEDFGRNKK